MTSALLGRFAVGIVLSLIQVLAALPWLALLEQRSVRERLRQPAFWGVLAAAVLGLGVVLGGVLMTLQGQAELEYIGRLYGSVLQAQLVADLLVVVFGGLLLAWPKGGSVALATFREGVRQPVFWLLVGIGVLLLSISPFLPYFTFGEDFLMMKELGYDMVMVFALIFGTLTASTSISEEIEGRTAVTLMSKPVSRRQFLLGKFVGIVLAAGVMTALLGWYFDWVLVYKRWYDRVDPTPLPAAVTAFLQSLVTPSQGLDLLRGSTLWFTEVRDVLPGLALGFCQVLVLLAIAVSLATRLPKEVNLPICLLVYFLGHLAPVLVQVSQHRLNTDPSGSAVYKMVNFTAQVFDTVLPALELSTPAAVAMGEQDLTFAQIASHVGGVGLYAVLYTIIVLLFGLILFEDRDLA